MVAPGGTAGATTSPVIPSWVKAGLRVHYVEDTADGRVDWDITDTVTSRAGGDVNGTTLSAEAGGGSRQTYYWQCSPDGDCPGHSATSSEVVDEPFLFWVDPNHPLGSVRGQGTPFSLLTYLGISNKDIMGRTYKVGTLYYTSGPRNIQTLVVYYLATNGLLLEERLTNKDPYLGPDILTWYAGESYQ
ncbi:MAG TPA: hypothetical protein VME46_25505 [Acidimicrobiales bacterium]|nr:hypothetical protein [Acidimicrobiales bacterium]